MRYTLLRLQHLAGPLLVLAYLVMAVAAPALAPPADPADPSPFRVVGRSYERLPHAPSPEARLGTTPGQFDVYYTLVWGTREALQFGLSVALFTGLIGVLIGAVSGYVEGWAGGAAMRVADAFLAFPVIAPVFVFQQILASAQDAATVGEASPLVLWILKAQIDPLLLVLVLFSWVPYARLTDTLMRRLKREEYVTAARALGATDRRILLRHLLPNAIAPALVLVARDIGGMVLLAATFTYIGLSGGSSWGTLLVLSRDWVIGQAGNPLVYWWVYVPITLALVLFGAGWSLLGDTLNVLMNPRGR